MSRDDWERGTITLPTAAVAKVKATVRNAANAHHATTLAECKAWWAKNKTTSPKLYNERLDARNSRLSETAYFVLLRLSAHPRQVQIKDLEHFAPKASGNRFQLGEASIRFDGRAVRWTVPENNHAVQIAHDHPVAGAFFTALSKVTWTRGSGGQIIGNDEYNQDTEYDGGGANYVTAHFGPTKARSYR